ncbi:MAG: hypothetical protein HY743_07155 [Deltaproteobacteria bacterium]|nr:hypothetical protein [Deltaproteobacteria bacterium]
MKIWVSASRADNRVKDIPLWSRSRLREGIWAALAGVVLWVAACGQLPPLPAQVDLESYAPITYQELLAPGTAKLQAGQKIKVSAYFWQYLTYDPAMVHNYLDMLRHPLSWYRLEWFATYGTSDMQGYYDLAALDPSLVKANKPRRLDHIMIYGELASLGPGLYLRVHRIERIEED